MTFFSRFVIALTLICATGSAEAGWLGKPFGACQSALLPVSSFGANVPLIAFGLGDSSGATESSLSDFARSRTDTTGHPVVMYGNLVDAHYLTAEEKENFAVPRNVRNAIDRATSLFPSEKVLQFNLDGFDPGLLFDADGSFSKHYTAFEAALILSTPRYLAATRWFRNGREMADNEVREFFSTLFQRLRDDPAFLRKSYPTVIQ